MEEMEETEIKVEVEELVEPLALVKRVEVEGEAEVSTTTPGELLISSSGGRGEDFLLRQLL